MCVIIARREAGGVGGSQAEKHVQGPGTSPLPALCPCPLVVPHVCTIRLLPRCTSLPACPHPPRPPVRGQAGEEGGSRVLSLFPGVAKFASAPRASPPPTNTMRHSGGAAPRRPSRFLPCTLAAADGSFCPVSAAHSRGHRQSLCTDFICSRAFAVPVWCAGFSPCILSDCSRMLLNIEILLAD